MVNFSELRATAITCCVDYLGYLEAVVPYNRHHFSDWWVITCENDPICEWNGVKDFEIRIFETDAWDLDKGLFRKWAALQDFLDNVNLSGWICFLDGDILIPKKVSEYDWVIGRFYVPFRRIDSSWTPGSEIPPEEKWKGFPLYPARRTYTYWSGYMQLFHTSDPVIVKMRARREDWFDRNLPYANVGDVQFSDKWPLHMRKRPPFEVLHLGVNGYFTGKWRGPLAERRLVLDKLREAEVKSI